MQSKSVVLNARNGDLECEAPEAGLGGHVPSAPALLVCPSGCGGAARAEAQCWVQRGHPGLSQSQQSFWKHRSGA